jgi:phosphoribosylpyrophosphate synthetase
MRRHIITGRTNPALGKGIASALGEIPAEHTVKTFPDGEIYVRSDADLKRGDIFVVQGTGPPLPAGKIPLETVSLLECIAEEIEAMSDVG